MSSSFIKCIYIFDIFYHFYQFERRISEVSKGKILCALGVKLYITRKQSECLHVLLDFRFNNFVREQNV